MLKTPSPAEAKVGLAVIKMIFTREKNQLKDWHHDFFTALKKHILKVDFDIESLGPVSDDVLQQTFQDPEIKKQFISGMVAATLLSGTVNPEENQLLQHLAQILGIQTPALKVFSDLSKKHFLMARIDFMRNSHIKRAFQEQYETHSLIDTVVNMGRAFGLITIEDQELAGKYRNLKNYPPNSLGFHYYQYIIQNGFSFPGEANSLPEAVTYHDLCHVLLGYPTTPEGETLISAFHAGHMKEGVLTAIMTLCQFTKGIRMLPSKIPLEKGTVFKDGMIERWFDAIERGSKVKSDLSDHWDFWKVMDKPIDEVRKMVNIQPI